MLRCKLKNIVARITTHLKHCHATTFRCCKLKQHLHQVELASTFFNKCFQLATTYFVAWQCLRWVVIRATMLLNLQCNNVALQVAAICFSYYFTFKVAPYSFLKSDKNVNFNLKNCLWIFRKRKKLCIFSRTFFKSAYLLLKLKEMFKCKKNRGSPNSFVK